MPEQKIIRLREGSPIPEGWHYSQLLATTLEPTGTGTAQVHVYTLLVTRDA